MKNKTDKPAKSDDIVLDYLRRRNLLTGDPAKDRKI